MDTRPKPHFASYPLYRTVNQFLHLLDGRSAKTLKSMIHKVWEHRGTPQSNADWSDPETWIPDILADDERELALHVWRESQGQLSPRYLDIDYSFCMKYGFIEENSTGTFHRTLAGDDFLEGKLDEEVDYAEGLIQLLTIVAEQGPAKRSTLIPPFAEFLERYTNIRSENAIGEYWYTRMKNLLDRKLIDRSGIAYRITDKGSAYLDQIGKATALMRQRNQLGDADAIDQFLFEISQDTFDVSLAKLLGEQKQAVRNQIRQTLGSLDPFDFEKLIGRLLETIGYDNVEVTAKHGDRGVDVKADLEVGITSIREVVQVKRHQGNVQRPILDQLRGSLHLFDAQRGTIITVGKFSDGAKKAAFEKGAAPITLIDGEHLIDLLIENEIGVKHGTIQVSKFDPDAFQFNDETPEE